MRNEEKRIFISDLPESLTKNQLENIFFNYGQVKSIEIKERKELGPHNKSLFFSYINITIDENSLNKCFRDFKSGHYEGQYILLQIARESFLDRLKREREETESKPPIKQTSNDVSKTRLKCFPETTSHLFSNPPSRRDILVTCRRQCLASVAACSYLVRCRHYLYPNALLLLAWLHVSAVAISMPPYKYASSSEDEIVDNSKTTVIENNQSLELPIKSKKLVIHKPNNTISENQNLDFKQTEVIEPPTKKLKNDSQANVKRLQSLKEMKKDYAAKKSLIKNALSYGGTPINKKIVFDNDVNGNVDNGKKKKYLFENEQMSDDSDFEPNFEVKEQFEGEKGRKLLELQSKYKNDKRFLLDERFIDDNDKIESEEQLDDLELEKQEQLKILEQVVGKKVTNQRQFNDRNATTNRKNMVKFDPTQPEHSNLIINNEGVKKQKKIRQKIDNTEPVKPEPQVSKEVFYKVPEKLKETFVNEKTQFSLLSTFSSNEPFEESVQDKSENQEKEIKKNSLINSRNPFKYDSSDEEDEVKDIPLKEDKPVADLKKQPPVRTLFWTEPFFFKADDFRLQEGMDFIEKIKTNVGTEFLAVRREVKGIVKAKVRNTVRKNKMFKKKLGGSKRRKHVRIKKALKK